MNEINLTGVPETMLWTLYNRAAEARRPGGFLADPECLRIYDAINYDFERNFGKPDGSHFAERSRIFDNAVRPWLINHPAGTVVELGAGLETQFQRCDNGSVSWVCVDVEEALEVRERFLPRSDRCRHIAYSALDRRWLSEVAFESPVFVTAQGLFMYFTEQEVGGLVSSIFDSFPNVELMFDTIPRWFSRKTLRGLRKSKSYVLPPMSWGVRRDDIDPLVRSWSPRITDVEVHSFAPPRWRVSAVVPKISGIRVLRNIPPTIVRVRAGGV